MREPEKMLVQRRIQRTDTFMIRNIEMNLHMDPKLSTHGSVVSLLDRSHLHVHRQESFALSSVLDKFILTSTDA